jgi:3-hydroxyacyl-[acyl-carrier-protein] dehydratase
MSPPAELRTPAEGLPHRHPFLFVSEVIELEPGVAATGAWDITGDEEFFRGHFPGEPVVPGALLAEALAQVSGIAAFTGAESFPRARLARIDVKISDAVHPPARVLLRSRLIGSMDIVYQFDVSAEAHGRIVCHGAIMLAVIKGAAS